MADIWWKADPHDLHRLTDRVSSVYIERSHVDRENNAVLIINRRENVRIRLGDVRALRGLPGVDWEAVRGLPKKAPSPLREYAKLAPTRAAAVRGFAQQLADRHGATVWAWHSPYSDRWELDWERTEDLPTEDTVRRELAGHPEASAYAAEVTLCPAWGEITWEAKELLEPGRAVVLDGLMRAEPCLTRDFDTSPARRGFTRSRVAGASVAGRPIRPTLRDLMGLLD
ncbi:hypothetical protein ACQV4C_31075 [Streptomyces albidoflavus]|uniref:hypothetical protein n=1 Tax=Streptomyces albidoflavus TaxID=1886 RepID=UPI003D16D952